MARPNRLFLKSWPYLASLASGIAIFFLATSLSEDYKSLLINIAAALVAIPLLFLIYELARASSSRRLNKELFEYAKMQIDREALSIVIQLLKLVIPYVRQDHSPHGLQAFLNQSEQDLRALFSKEQYLGFQALKRWTTTEDRLAKILENPFVLQRLVDDQAIAVLTLLKRIRSLENLHRDLPDLYTIHQTKDADYTTKAGHEISKYNTDLPERRLLLKRLAKDRYQVVDFGDFTPYEVPKLLNFCSVTPKYVDCLASAVFYVIAAINGWFSSTGNEFIVDSRMFRARVPA